MRSNDYVATTVSRRLAVVGVFRSSTESIVPARSCCFFFQNRGGGGGGAGAELREARIQRNHFLLVQLVHILKFGSRIE